MFQATRQHPPVHRRHATMPNLVERIALCNRGAISNAAAQADLADQIAKADLDYGEYLAGECVTCHRKSGAGIPQINGIEAETFVTIMKAYRSKELDNKVMQMMAGRLDDEQIISLAAYFSSLPK